MSDAGARDEKGEDKLRSSAAPHDEALAELSRALWRWLAEAALPLWWRLGADHAGGGFHEALGQDGLPVLLPRRCRLQPRQIYAFALASRLGWSGPAAQAVEHGLSYFLGKYRRADGLFRASVEPDGQAADDQALLYDQAFALLGFFGAHELAPGPALRELAADLLGRIHQTFKHPGGGFREHDDAPFQSNAQMHLFEACIAWSGVAGGPFAETADEIGALCLDRLIDTERGAIDEYYDGAWRPDGPGGDRRIEPGHQFEWAWLLSQWSEAGASTVRGHAERLFHLGEASVSGLRVAPAAVSVDGRITDPLSRLWPQTERLRTAILLAQKAGPDRPVYERAALDAGGAILTFLDTPLRGLWRDKLRPDGTFVEEPAPASTLYHLAGAIAALKDRVADAAPSTRGSAEAV